MAKKFYTDNEIDFIKKYYSTNGPKFCSESLNRPISGIEYKANSLGLKVDKKRLSDVHRQIRLLNPYLEKRPEEYKVNPNNFIKNITKESAYILGLLWADGWINKQSIRIECVREDVNIFLPIFLKTGKWNSHFRKRKGRREQGLICTNNKLLSNYLLSLGYGPHTFTSADKILNTIPDHLKHLWFRGLVDGDGCWYISKDKIQKQFSLAGGYDQDWSYFTNLLETLNINYKIQRRITKTWKSSYVRITDKTNLFNLGKYLYSSYQESKIGLERKYNKYIDIINNFKVKPQ